MTGSETLLQTKGLTRRFGGLVALNNLDMTLNSGEILALLGPNGSGKTTFFNTLTGIFPANDGASVFQGVDITGHSPQAVYKAGIARTFQRSRLSLELSIFDNIVVGNHHNLNNGLFFNLISRRAMKAEYEANLENARSLIKTFDPPLADRMFEAVGSFPMIDRRRIEICRALISNPKLLLLDEPSAGMTHDETRQLIDDILEVRSNIGNLSIIIIEHEMGMIERMSVRCLVLNFGKKICEGPFSEIEADKDVQEAYLGSE